MTRWRDITPEAAATLTPEELAQLDLPLNEAGEPCPWPWEPQQLVGAPLGQYHCPYCGAMVIAGITHLDYKDVLKMQVTAYWYDGHTAAFPCENLVKARDDYRLTSENEVILIPRAGVRYVHMDANNLPKMPAKKTEAGA